MDTIDLYLSPHLASITLNRPERHNAFDDAMLKELLSALQQIAQDSNIRLVLLKANGKSFSAGADINWMQRMVDYSYQENIADAQLLADVMEALASLPQPTVAVVQGAAFGGGVGLVACCDIAIAADQVEFCLSEVKLGLIPAVISPYLVNVLGHKTALRYALTAERFTAEQACEMGLITEVVAQDALEARTADWIQLFSHCAPTALRECKKLYQQLAQASTPEARKALTVETIARVRVSPEGQEGLAAFLAKRKPAWLAHT
jgi:methylglutaconyl-CoA hydratase